MALDHPRSDPKTSNPRLTTSSSICVPLLFSSSSFHNSNDNSSMKKPNPNQELYSNSNSRFSSTVSEKGGGQGPAFVGQVFSMCDVSRTGLMAVSTHFQIPFLSKSFICQTTQCSFWRSRRLPP